MGLYMLVHWPRSRVVGLYGLVILLFCVATGGTRSTSKMFRSVCQINVNNVVKIKIESDLDLANAEYTVGRPTLGESRFSI